MITPWFSAYFLLPSFAIGVWAHLRNDASVRELLVAAGIPQRFARGAAFVNLVIGILIVMLLLTGVAQLIGFGLSLGFLLFGIAIQISANVRNRRWWCSCLGPLSGRRHSTNLARNGVLSVAALLGLSGSTSQLLPATIPGDEALSGAVVGLSVILAASLTEATISFSLSASAERRRRFAVVAKLRESRAEEAQAQASGPSIHALGAET